MLRQGEAEIYCYIETRALLLLLIRRMPMFVCDNYYVLTAKLEDLIAVMSRPCLYPLLVFDNKLIY